MKNITKGIYCFVLLFFIALKKNIREIMTKKKDIPWLLAYVVTERYTGFAENKIEVIIAVN